jgi:putative hydrolase of the HAD superfamily
LLLILKKYQHIFFDLDHTLWDFERNSEETISELFHELKMAERGVVSARNLYLSFERANREAWDLYHLNKIDKEELRISRFSRTLAENGITDHPELAEMMAQFYLSVCPTKPHLFDGSIEILDHLVSKYPLYLISNGFAETTDMKVQASEITKYFKTVITPTHSGFKKPEKEMFLFALSKANCKPEQAIMIGDDLQADILGAQNAGIDQVFFNPNKKTHELNVTFEISKLEELKSILV